MAGFDRGAFRVTLGVGTSAGGVASVANPEGKEVYVTRLIVNLPTQSSGSGTIDVGIAANGTTSNDGLIDGLSTAAAGVFCNLTSPGSNGKAGKKWGASEYLTASQATGAVAGLAGELIVEYLVTGS